LVVQWQVRPRNFKEAVFKYRSTPSGMLPTDADLERTIRKGVAGTAMPAFTRLPDKDIRAVIEFIKSFSPAWNKSENFAEPITVPPIPKWFEDSALRLRYGVEGRGLFLKTCAPCHGERADGKGLQATNLVDNLGALIRPADLRQPLRSGSTPVDTWRTIATGISGTPMASFQSAFTPEQMWSLVAFIHTVTRSD
jgi:cytochrome c oxidase cbb3-type subunit 2